MWSYNRNLSIIKSRSDIVYPCIDNKKHLFLLVSIYTVYTVYFSWIMTTTTTATDNSYFFMFLYPSFASSTRLWLKLFWVDIISFLYTEDGLKDCCWNLELTNPFDCYPLVLLPVIFFFQLLFSYLKERNFALHTIVHIWRFDSVFSKYCTPCLVSHTFQSYLILSSRSGNSQWKLSASCIIGPQMNHRSPLQPMGQTHFFWRSSLLICFAWYCFSTIFYTGTQVLVIKKVRKSATIDKHVSVMDVFGATPPPTSRKIAEAFLLLLKKSTVNAKPTPLPGVVWRDLTSTSIIHAHSPLS